ncbi:MAG: hypothetical protein KGL70_03910 [Betaproteobacteria bacterium]|nr:hypothetical protein [Betaproteobacteria bacterium]MDE2358510.1 hypothetical protein [Betaproteobacteria bacterium]
MMRNAKALAVAAAPRPVLDLSGPKLKTALESLVVRTEDYGGVERYVDAVKLKSALFAQALGEGRARAVDPKTLRQLLSLIATVRRRVGPYLDECGFGEIRTRLAELLDAARDTSAADDAIAAFCAHFPDDREHRWVRDLAVDVLHNVDPERYPLMCRWVWDQRANTGVLREIWHADNVDHMVIDVPDRHETFVVLREELSQYLTTNGVFRDVLQYVDLLTAQVYAEYISEQGGSYLRTDFASPEDPMLHTRRMLGLDVAVDGRSKLKAVDGMATIADLPRLTN